MWDDGSVDFTADTFDDCMGNQTRQHFQGKPNKFNGNRGYFNPQYYQFIQLSRCDNKKQFAFQHALDGGEKDTPATPNFRNRSAHNGGSFQKYSYKPRNNYPAFKSLNPRRFPKGYGNLFTQNKNKNETFSQDVTCEDFGGNWVNQPNNTPREANNNAINKKEAQKLKILRHKPIPASVTKTPKKILEKITKFNKASLKNIINNPSKYDDVLQKFGREHELEEQKNEAPLTKAVVQNSSDEDKGTFEIVPDDEIEVSPDFFDFLQMQNSPMEAVDATNIAPSNIEESAIVVDSTEIENDKPDQMSEIPNDECQNKPDLMSRLIAAETVKTSHAKNQAKKFNQTDKNVITRSRTKQSVEKINEKGTDCREEFKKSPTNSKDTENSNVEDKTSETSEKARKSAERDKTPSTTSQKIDAAYNTPRRRSRASIKSITEMSPKGELTNLKSKSESLKDRRCSNDKNNFAKIEKNAPKSEKNSPKSEKNSPNSAVSTINQRNSRADSFLNSAKKNVKIRANETIENKEHTDPKTPTTSAKKLLGKQAYPHKPFLEEVSKRSRSSSTSSSSSSSSSTSSTSTTSSTTSTATSRSSSRSSCNKPTIISQPNLQTHKLPPEVRKRILMERRRRILSQKLNIQYIVDTFESRILPNLSENLVQRYRDKYSKSLDTKLLFICRICTSNQHKKILQHDLKSTDKKKAIVILMREVTNVINNKQPQDDEVPSNADTKHTNNNLVEETQTQTQTDLMGSVVKIADVAVNAKPSLDQSTKNDTPTQQMQQHVAASNGDKIIADDERNSNYNRKEASYEMKDENNQVLHDFSKDLIIKSDISSENGNLATYVHAPQFLTTPSQQQSSIFTNFQAFANMNNLTNNLLPPLNISAIHQQRQHQQQQQQQQSTGISDPWLSNIQEIDFRITDLTKRKQFTNEMIAKLQKDNMEVDIQIVGLQKEKFMLLNAAITAKASTTNSPTSIGKVSKETSERHNAPKSKKCVKRNLAHSKLNGYGYGVDTPKSKYARYLKTPKNGLSRLVAMDETQHQSDKENTEITNALITTGTTTSTTDPLAGDSLHLDAFDYSNVPAGEICGIESPVNQLCIYQSSILAASEDGHLYRFNMSKLEMLEQCQKHDAAITQLNFCAGSIIAFTTSLDGYFKATPLNDLQSETLNLHLDEQLQSLDLQWDSAFIGARSGKIYTCNIKNDPLTATILHAGDSSVMAIKATKEGPRKILIISSKGNSIVFRDAISGLLLRTLNVADNLCIYGFLFDESHLYCGTQRQQILKYDFTTGSHISTFYCGNGVVAIKLYRSKFLVVACYDGYIYILNKTTGDKVDMLPASGRLPLTLEIFGNKIITSSKDKTLKIIDIPKLVVNG